MNIISIISPASPGLPPSPLPSPLMPLPSALALPPIGAAQPALLDAALLGDGLALPGLPAVFDGPRARNGDFANLLAANLPAAVSASSPAEAAVPVLGGAVLPAPPSETAKAQPGQPAIAAEADEDVPTETPPAAAIVLSQAWALSLVPELAQLAARSEAASPKPADTDNIIKGLAAPTPAPISLRQVPAAPGLTPAESRQPAALLWPARLNVEVAVPAPASLRSGAPAEAAATDGPATPFSALRGWQASLPAVALAPPVATAPPPPVPQTGNGKEISLLRPETAPADPVVPQAVVSGSAVNAPAVTGPATPAAAIAAPAIVPANAPAPAANPAVAEAGSAAIRPLPARINWLRAGAAQSFYGGAVSAGGTALPSAGTRLPPAGTLSQPGGPQLSQPFAAPPASRSDAIVAAQPAAVAAGPFPAGVPAGIPAGIPAGVPAGPAPPIEFALADAGAELPPPLPLEASAPPSAAPPSAASPSQPAAQPSAIPASTSAVPVPASAPALPEPSLAIASDRLGPVRVDVSGSLDRLEINLSASAASAPILAGEAARLAQDLAAAGIALASYAVNGQRADVAAPPAAPAAGAGFGTATGGNGGQAASHGGQHAAAQSPSPVPAAFAGPAPPGASVRRSHSPSDRFA